MRRLLRMGLYQLCIAGGMFFVAFLAFAAPPSRTPVLSPVENEEYQAVMADQVADIYDL